MKELIEEGLAGDTERKGGWFLTNSGIRFYPLDYRPEDIVIEDIAHHLSLVCRFGGAIRAHYSVAEHSYLVAMLVEPELRYQALMHDATEAYFGDVVRALKRALPEYVKAEKQLWKVIAEKFGIPEKMHPSVKKADNIACSTEARDLLPKFRAEDWDLVEPAADHWRIVTPMHPKAAASKFLRCYQAWKPKG